MKICQPLHLLAGSVLAFHLAGGPRASLAAEPLSAEFVARHCALAGESVWRAAAGPSSNLSSRAVFSYALSLCEAKLHPERLERLFDLVARMQDRNPKSRGYGNFWWKIGDGKVMDYNAVDFCMRGGALLWLRHRDSLPPAARAKLRELLDFAVEGSLRHKVAESYSNIALMNAGNLLVLGEALGRPEVADEGAARLERVVRYTCDCGTHEFVSPTYTGVDLDDLTFIEAFVQRAQARAQARALLELFWTDIALNWFPPAQKLAGAHSRTYDYLRGLGYLDVPLTVNGWLPGPLARDCEVIYSGLGQWRPPERLRALSDQFPRLVRQSWGCEPHQSRTHLLLPDVTLSTAASSYGGRMDMPLTVDLPGSRTAVRGYFIADGRDDPYGKKKIAAGPHAKAFHLDPFWAAAQRGPDALGLVVYRDKDIPTNAVTLASHFVLPRDAEGFWVGEKPVHFKRGEPARIEVRPGETVVLRKGSAAVGIRVPWARSLGGRVPPVALVNDGNEFGAVRLTVDHAAGERLLSGNSQAAAVFWVRVAGGLKSEADVAAWCGRFAAERASVEAGQESLHIRVAGGEGPVAVSAAAPFKIPSVLEPAPSRAVLELDGREVGRPLLSGTGACLTPPGAPPR